MCVPFFLLKINPTLVRPDDMLFDEDLYRCRVSEDITAGFYNLTVHRVQVTTYLLNKPTGTHPHPHPHTNY